MWIQALGSLHVSWLYASFTAHDADARLDLLLQKLQRSFDLTKIKSVGGSAQVRNTVLPREFQAETLGAACMRVVEDRIAAQRPPLHRSFQHNSRPPPFKQLSFLRPQFSSCSGHVNTSPGTCFRACTRRTRTFCCTPWHTSARVAACCTRPTHARNTT